MPEPTLRDWDVFAEAVELSAPERTALLAKLGNVDPSLARRVEALLAAHDRAGTFLADPPPAATPTHIGRYRLIERIGEGGFGVVYLAEQEEPVRRQVALKVIKLGMDTASTVARFEGERQALALMDHPNIAKVLDGGETDTGRPYFVMELVRGVPITRYCSDAQLTMQARLELFIQVCHAVQHAHQKGIIHR
ncbi:MAG: protein kinase, partial [Opitutaceae bacterium]|nr:protein kinase [Opitutaceae bacterium]